MSDKLDDALVDLITKSTNAIGEAVTFIQAQLPDVLQQFLLYALVKHSLILVVGLGALAISVYATYWYFRHSATYWPNTRDPDNIVPFTLVWFIGVVAIFSSGANWLGQSSLAVVQIWLAPKVYLLEHAREMLK